VKELSGDGKGRGLSETQPEVAMGLRC